MKKSFLNIIALAAMALMGSSPVAAQSSDAIVRDRVTGAVMKVYDDHLAQNPNDYNILFARAHQNFYNGDYTAALTDVNQAMLLTPKTDKELRFDEHILRARISEARQDYASELADLKLAQELQPKSLACTDMIAKANFKAGNLDAAEKAFKKILRAESMNYDAMYGLARVYQARGNAKAAIEQVDKAVGLFRVEPQVYVNRADIHASQGNIEAAVQDLLAGMSVGDGGNAAQALFDLSDMHYEVVMNSLLDLANKANNPDDNGIYRYLRANIAMDHTRFAQALNDLKYIKRNRLYNSPTVDSNVAKCCLELARWEDALTSADLALAATTSLPEVYVVKALAEYHQGEGGHFDNAMEALNRCSELYPQYVPMLITKALLLMKQNEDNEALSYLNAAVANDPTNSEALFLRGTLFKKNENLKLAVRDYNTIVALVDDYHYRGMALSELGRDSEAMRWLNQVLAANQPGGENFYQASLFMALRGDNYKAMEYVQRALDKGYGSLYRLRHNDLSPVNLSSLYGESSFDLNIDKARRNFIESE